MNIRDVLSEIKPLTDGQILDAQEVAKALTLRALGDAPDRAQFERYHATQTPRAVALTIAAVLGAAALAAFALSVFRVFTAGRDLFLGHIDEPLQAAIAGAATFLLAELLVVGSMLARAVYFTGSGRAAMSITAAIGVSMALAGNLTISSPPLFNGGSMWEVSFAWLDALAPPVAVLLIAIAFERMVVQRVQAHQEIEAAYQAALNEWKARTVDPESSELYQKKYLPRALKQAIADANGRGTGAVRRKELLQALRPEHWNYLVLREIRAADWYDTTVEAPESIPLEVEVPAPEVVDQFPFGNTAVIPAGRESGLMSVHANGHGGIRTGES
jgi:hypothetical protein